jgi:hypothetical protein
MKHQNKVYLEIGKKRTFAVSVDWPGWARQASDEAAAIDGLLAFAPKYAAILKGTRLGFVAPKSIEDLLVIQRLKGNATTDFGAPGIPPDADADRSCTPAELKRFEKILHAGWQAFDATVKAAHGKTLATGPRGGGRTLTKIVEHVIEAEAMYIAAAGWAWEKPASPRVRMVAGREALVNAMHASAAGEIPVRGPRGGARWSARYLVRRAAWHVFAHIWEIERRVGAAQ